MHVNGREQDTTGLWEPDDPMLGVEENDLDQMDPEQEEDDVLEDDEARVFHQREVVYKYYRDPDVTPKATDPYENINIRVVKKLKRDVLLQETLQILTNC
ncbi:unnamed protein product [Urochloa humidicola]